MLLFLQDGPIKVELFSNDVPIVDSISRKGLLENEIGEEDNTSPMDSFAKKARKSKELKPLLEFLDGAYCLTGVRTN